MSWHVKHRSTAIGASSQLENGPFTLSDYCQSDARHLGDTKRAAEVASDSQVTVELDYPRSSLVVSRIKRDALTLIVKAREDCEAIAMQLLGPFNASASTKQNLRWYSDGKLSLTIAGQHRGKWRNFATDAHGDICDLVQITRAISRREALDWLEEWLGETVLRTNSSYGDARRIVAATDDRNHDLMTSRYGVQLFEDAPARFEGTPGSAYLQKRHEGMVPATIISGGALRFDEKHRTFLGKTVPGAIGAMLALMTHPITGKPTGCHRTYIDSNLDRIERGMLGLKGVVRLLPDNEVSTGLAIGEGIESSISGYLLFDAPPVWSALDAGNLGKFPLLGGVEALTVFADNDPNGTGQDNARKCMMRWRAGGREVTLHTPRAGDSDFNDMLQDLVAGGGST